jgi:hypothetical protein
MTRSRATDLRSYRIAFREVLGGASLIFVIAATVSFCTEGAAHAQAADYDAPAPVVDYDFPAPVADYDLPADAATAADADPDSGADPDTDSRVLEIPQVADPARLAVAAPPSSAPASTGDGDWLSNADDDVDPGSISDDAKIDTPPDGPIGDAQDYQDQEYAGAVEVYPPVYLAPAPTYVAPMPIAPVQSYALGSVGAGRFQVGGGTRLFNSPLGGGFGMPRGPMAMGGFGHRR